MRLGSGLLTGIALLALSSCSQKDKPPAPLTAAEVNGAAIIAADDRPGVWLSHGRTYSCLLYTSDAADE